MSIARNGRSTPGGRQPPRGGARRRSALASEATSRGSGDRWLRARIHRVLCLVVLLVCVRSLAASEAASRGRYLVLTSKQGTPPPFAAVDMLRGPKETVDGRAFQWWQMELRGAPEQDSVPLMALRALTSSDLLSGQAGTNSFARYVLRLPSLGEVLDYRDEHTGGALLPPWRDFERLFVPHRSEATRDTDGWPRTCELLGHVLTLVRTGGGEGWPSWEPAKVLKLDRELLVGTGRNAKDREGIRLSQAPQRQDYHYVEFENNDYATMVEAGINLFNVSPRQEAWIRAEPVFYLRGAGKDAPLRYPADLYRANYLGVDMFMDEPSIIMVGDKQIHTKLRYFSDAAALIEKRTRAAYLAEEGCGAFHLDRALRAQGANLGDIRIMQWDLPTWETLYETAFYQMKGGGSGIVHEGRYQLAEFDQWVERFAGEKRAHTARELLQYYYAFLRGGARPFQKFWGTAIYGQCDTNIAPEAVRLAYDMGARYVWFWTSDHDHHVPWPEQLALARTLKQHAQQHRRASMAAPPPMVDTLLLVPNGCFLSLENLWWVRAMDKEGKNQASQQYRRLMRAGLKAYHECLARGESFDISVDDGRPIQGYRRVVRLGDLE